MPPINVLLKPSSSLCNMNCDYCFYCDEASKRKIASYGFMEENTLKNIIRRTLSRAEKTAAYAYQGGEPTLRGLDFFRKAVKYQNQYNKNHVFISNALQTNGFALDKEWCRFLSENHFLVGLSVDGTEEIHNAHRHDKAGNGTYARIRQAAKLMDQYQVEYNILTVVTSDVAEHIEEIYEEYKRNGWNYQQYIACLPPMRQALSDSAYVLSPEAYGDFLIRLFHLWYRDWKKNRQPYIRQFENWIGMLAGYPPEACDQHGTCGIQYVVEADGSVYPCDFYMLDEYRLGNLNENRVAQLDEARVQIKFVERSFALDPSCRECRYYFLCRGGCQRCRKAVSGQRVYRNMWCESYRMFFDACLKEMQEVAASVPHI